MKSGALGGGNLPKVVGRIQAQLLAPGVRAHGHPPPLPPTHQTQTQSSQLPPSSLLDQVCLPRVGVQNPEKERGEGKRVKEGAKGKRAGWGVSKPRQALGPPLTEALFRII